jgi:hypothetical protein
VENPAGSLDPAMPDKNENNLLKVAMVQDGARLHYAVPLALHRAGALGAMFSEGYLKPGIVSNVVMALGKKGLVGRGAMERRCDEIPASLVQTNFLMAWKHRKAKADFPSLEAYYQWSSQQVGKWILSRGIGDCNAIHGFIRNLDPQMCGKFHQRGILTCGDQIIAPAAIEGREAKLQNERWPDWERPAHQPDFEIVEEVERDTWRELDQIICASEYVKKGLIEQGVDDGKIAVLPYPIDALKYAAIPREEKTGLLTVGFVGSVNLRKGTPYFLEVAKRLTSQKMRFVMVGPNSLEDAAQRSLSKTVQLTGRVNRTQVIKWLERFDILFFPSTCEGSAGAVMEAMAAGLPVVTSSNSGSIVRDGVDGFIRPYDDVEGYCHCIQKLADDLSLRLHAGIEARRSAEAATLDNYGARLVAALKQAHSRARISEKPAIG